MCSCFSGRFEEETGMPKKRHRPEEIIKKLSEADVPISLGKMVVEFTKALAVTDVT
jgi:putative transposase